MRNLLVWLGFTLISMTANAAEYKCYASKYPSGVQHSFENGYVLLKINKKSVNFKYFYVNTVAHETTIELDVNYKLQGVVGGNGQVKDMISGSLVSGDTPFPGDEIETMFFDPAL
ncbi:MAG: hypothetical protein NTV34_01800, partial [Proteobacteria bacterium]|nr:hypothetical protein [Pseudomonadota bacterium]